VLIKLVLRREVRYNALGLALHLKKIKFFLSSHFSLHSLSAGVVLSCIPQH
jgi:hypothetical protein